MSLQIKKKNLGSNEVDGSKILLAQGQAIRGFDQNGIEKDLIEFGESGEILVNGSEVTYKSVTDVIESDLSNEVARAISEEEALLEEINLGMRVSNDRWAATQAADTAIRSEFAAADSVEQSARIAGDETAQANLVSAEAGLIQLVESEELRASDAEILIAGRIDQEIFDRVAGDVSTLAESKSYTDGKVSLVLSNLDSTALDSLVEVVGAFQQADQDLNNAISGLATQLDVRIDQVDIDVDSLEMRMLSAEGNISNEVSRATSEELLLKSRVTTAEQDVDSLEMRMLSAEGNISNEVSRATSEELLLKSRATTSEQDIDSLEMRMLSSEGNISNEISRATSEELLIRSDFATADAAKLVEAKAYTDAQIATIPEVDLSGLETRVSNAESDIVALEVYSKNIVHVDAVNGIDEIGRGSLLRPFKTINFAYSQVPSLGNPSNTSYNANVGKFVTEKLIINLAPGRYTENVVLGFKRARVQLKGDGATIIGDVKTSVKLADFPCAALENMKASFPAPFTGVSAFMNIEISGNAGGGLESDPTSSVFTITGQASLAFEESTVAGFGTGLNWDSSHGQFYANLDSASVGNWVVTSSYTANMARALPSGVIEVDSCNIASSTTYRMFFGAVPYSYLTDFATWNVASKGTVNKAPNSGLTLKAHNSTFGNVIGPALTLGEIDGCRIYDIDRTMRGTVDNGSIIGSTSTSYLGFVNNQFRIFSGSGDLASFYKLGQAVGATRYKMDSVSHTTMSFNRSSSGVLTARALDLGAGVSFDFLDDARSISVADPATNYTRTASTVDASLEGIDTALGLKASSASVIAGNASSLVEAKAYTDTQIAAIPSVDLSSYETIANVDSKDAAKLVEAKAYADQVSSLAQDNAEDYTDSQIAAIPAVDLSNYYITSEVDELIAGQEAYSDEVADNTLTASIEASKAYADATFALITDVVSIDQSLMAAQEETALLRSEAFEAIGTENLRAFAAEASLQSQITNVLSNVDGAALDSLTEIVSAFQAADSTLNGAITSLASSASSAISTEQAARIAADSALQGEIDAEEVARAAADTTLQNNISSEASIRASAISSVQSAVDAEETRAMGVEAQLQSDHDDLDGYAQDIRSDVDDLDGYAQDIRSDLDSEISRAQAAESSISSALSALSASHDSRLDVLEAQTDGPSFHKMKIEISTNLVYVELAHQAIANSIVVSVGRLMAHKDEDFTVSVVGGVTHLTWIGSMVSPDGVEAIESGDKVFVTYAY
jgi:hypothetical protein